MNSELENAHFSAQNITKEFPTPGEPLKILQGVSVGLNRGDNLAVIGPSGSGKSTFLHIAGTLDRATSGTVRLLGTSIDSLAESDTPAFRNRHIGFIFQEHFLLPQLTAFENVMIPLVPSGRKQSDSNPADRARYLLERVGLKDRMTHLPSQLSGGERQRVAVARALICNPELVLADEPTGSLDQANAEKIGGLLLELQKENNAMLICVTHSERLANLFQRNVRLEEGRFV